MPIYAFACSACGHHFDRLQKLSDADPSACPACGAEGSIARQLTAPQFRLAGGGWYETDFKKDGDKKRNLAETSSGEGKPDSKTAEAKPAEAKSDAGKPVASTPAASPSSPPASATAAGP